MIEGGSFSLGVAGLLLAGPAPGHVDELSHPHEHDGVVHEHPHAHPSAEVSHHDHSHRDEDEVPKHWRVGAMVDVAYAINNNFPRNHVNRGHATAARTGELALNYVNAYLIHTPRRAAPFRLELALQAGSNVEATYGGEPSGSYVGTDAFKHVGLANAGIVAPWGHARGFTTETGAGVFSSPITLGSYWSRNSWNYTSAWANSATPYYLMGAHVTQTFAHRVKLAAWMVNGWQTISDANEVPSYMASLSAEPVDGLSIAENFIFGPEHGDISPEAWRIHSDTSILFEREKAGVGLFFDYGQERETDNPARPVHRWAGGAVLARWRVHELARGTWDMAVRPEAWWEPDGTFFGVPQALISASFTNSLDLFGHALARIEYRYDHSLAENGFFYAGDATRDTDVLARNQHTVFLSIVGYFEYAFSGRRLRDRRQSVPQ